MAKGIYAGVGGLSKKVKSIYVGDNGAAKKVKKVYVGVNGEAKLAWSGFTPKYAIPVLTGNKSDLKGYAQVYSSETLDSINYEISSNIAEVPCNFNAFTSALTGFVSANGIYALSVSELKNSNTNGVFYSTDCVSWTFVPIASGTGYLYYVNNEFLYTVETTVYKSTDCIHWTNVGTISGLGNYAYIKRIVYANDQGTMKYVCLVRYGNGGVDKFFMGANLVGTYTQYSPSSFNNALDIMVHPTDESLWTMYTTTETNTPCYVENKTYYTSRYRLITNTINSSGSGYGVPHGFMNDGTYMYALADIVVAKSTETRTGSMTMTELYRRASGGIRIDRQAYTDVVFEKEGNAYELITKNSTPYYAFRRFPYPYTTPTEIVFTSHAPTYGSGYKNLSDRRATILMYKRRTLTLPQLIIGKGMIMEGGLNNTPNISVNAYRACSYQRDDTTAPKISGVVNDAYLYPIPKGAIGIRSYSPGSQNAPKFYDSTGVVIDTQPNWGRTGGGELYDIKANAVYVTDGYQLPTGVAWNITDTSGYHFEFDMDAHFNYHFLPGWRCWGDNANKVTTEQGGNANARCIAVGDYSMYKNYHGLTNQNDVRNTIMRIPSGATKIKVSCPGGQHILRFQDYNGYVIHFVDKWTGYEYQEYDIPSDAVYFIVMFADISDTTKTFNIDTSNWFIEFE